MNPSKPPKEFRLKSGRTILNYLYQFSATEKAVFGILVIIAGITALIMVSKVNSYFMTEIPGNGGELREALVGLPRTINPVLAVTDVDRDISTLVYSGLLRYDGASLVPDLAKSYTVSDDGLTYTFILKDGAKFHDGKPLTADDVIFTIQKVQDPGLKSPRRADWANVTVKASSTNLVQFTLKQPYSPFLSNLTLGIIPKHIWKEVSNEQFIFSEFNIEPVGSGPYRAGSITRDSGGIPTSYKFNAWNDYVGHIPHLSTINFNFFADEEKALSAFNNGSVDSISSISSGEAARLASNTGEKYKIISSPLPRTFGVFLNQNQSTVLADKNVRMALNMAVNRTEIIQKALDGYGKPLFGPLPYDPSSNVSGSTTANIPAAQALLEKNGWKKDPATGIYGMTKKGSKTIQTLSFDIYTADTPDLKKVAELVKQYWTTLGAQVGIKIFEPADLYQNIIRTRKYDALLFGEFVGKDRDLYAFWHSSQRNQPGLNVAMYVNSKADKLLEDIRITNSADIRDQKYKEFSTIITSDVPAIFLYVPDFIYAIPKSLKDVGLGSVTIPSDRFNSVSNWYITTEKVWKIFTDH